MNSPNRINNSIIVELIVAIHKFRNSTITIIALFAFINAYSQQNLFQFKHITADEGLSSSQVVSIYQDYKGFMWLGTYDGLNRFDGTNIKVYRNVPSDSTSIPENHVMTIFEDHNKNLIIGTLGGLCMYDRNLNRFVNWQDQKTSALYNMPYSFLSIVEDSIGNLWLTTSEGLFYFDRKNNKIAAYTHDPLNKNSISNNFVETAYIDSHNRLWLATGKGLNLFNYKTKSFQHITYCKSHNEDVSNTLFRNIIEDKSGNVYFGSNEGLFCLKNTYSNTFELIHYKNDPLNANSISHNYVKSLFFDEKEHLWIGTENGGINIFNSLSETFDRIRIDEFNPKSLNNESIHAISQDRNGNIWIGTFGGGVNIIVKNSDFILHYKNLPGAYQSLSHNIVTAFLEDIKDNIWIATDGGGLNMFENKTNRFVRYTMSNSQLKSNAVLCLEEGETNQIWMGTWAGGLVNFNTVTHQFKSYNTANSGISDDNIHSIAKDKNGNLWLGSQNGGLIKFDIKANKFKVFVPENSKISSNRISAIRIDKYGNLYLAATISLQIYNPEKNSFLTYSYDPNNTKSISSNSVLDICIQNDTLVWIATINGLNQFNPKSGIFKRYFQQDGLPNNLIQGLTLDASGILWITTHNGLCRFNYRNNTFKNYTKSDGLQGNEFTDKSIITTRKGAILAGGKNGFNIISPKKIPENKSIPDVIITDFQIFNQPVSIGFKDSPLKKQITETKEITLNYKQSVLTFYFAVMDFTNPSKNQYAYMMEGFDKDWNYCGNKKEATYTNLNPGKYIFRVKGSNNDGVWNNTGTAIEIVIKPPWWKTKIAIIGYVLLVICSFLGIYYYRVNRLRKQKKLLEKLVAERTAELALKNEIVIEANLLLKERQLEIEQKNEILLEQADQLNESNTQLEERQMQIEEQSEELSVQKEELQVQRDHLNELNVTKDKLFSILGHDLRSPFTNILGFSDLLLNKFRGYSQEKTESHLTVIRDAARDTLNLLNNLLEWSRAQRGILHLEPEELKISEVLGNELRILRQQGDRKEVELEFSILGSEYMVVADLNIICTVMRNLISNAIKFSNKKSIVNITLDYQQANMFTFSVKDEGVGMSAEKMEALFKSNINTSTRGTAGEKGTGLGLLLCADFIEKQKGKIWVESEVNKGSTFYFSIPAKQTVSST